MLAMAHDLRIQRDDLGMICLSEINLGMPIPPGMLILIRDKVTYSVLRQLALFGHKFKPKESLAAGLLDKICPNEKLLAECIEMVAPFVEKSSAREAFSQIKGVMNRRGIDRALTDYLPPDNLLWRLNTKNSKL